MPFNCCLKSVMFSVDRMEVGSSFHQREADRVKVLEGDFVLRCEGVTMQDHDWQERSYTCRSVLR